MGIGIVDYFKDNWNRFDFFLVCITLCFDGVFSSMRIFRTAKAGKVTKLSRLGRSQKLIRIFKVCRFFKAFRMCRFMARTFKRVHQLFYKTLCCFPSIIKIVSVVCVLFYIYALIGMELFSTKGMREDATHLPDYERMVLGDFNTFPMAWLALF